MNQSASSSAPLIERLPTVRGRLTADAPLANFTWFRVGGPAEVLFRPEDKFDLAEFIRAKPADVPLTVIGVGSNLLVRDGGVKGVVVRLGAGFADIDAAGETIEAGSGALDLNLALTALEASLGGLEFLSGVPGTIGGALRMNAGAYGREFGDVLIEAEALDPQGNFHTLGVADLDLSYRHCGLPEDWIFTRALLRGTPAPKEEIGQRMGAIKAAREETQPLRTRTGGSTFANPDPEISGGLKAWELVDQAGCRGLTVGGAMVSEKHCNFLINTGNATAADIETLGEEVRRRVQETSGVTLRWEIRRIGEFLS